MPGQFNSATGAEAAHKRHEASRTSHMPQPRVHRATSHVQSVDIQSILHRIVLQLGLDFGNAQTTAERQRIAASLAKTTEAWRTATSERREILGKPRAGQLSPAERAELRRRKSNGAPRQSGPSVARRKEQLEATQAGPVVSAEPPPQNSSG